ncbi:MAG: hypothetical protein PHV50_03985 [Syntrophaceticus sp.]|nr:hypothetical protein [Syntrophaceticus sp.]
MVDCTLVVVEQVLETILSWEGFARVQREKYICISIKNYSVR